MPWTHVFSDLNVQEIVGVFYENDLHKTNQTECRIGKVLKK